jgi:hypothetical protein
VAAGQSKRKGRPRSRDTDWTEIERLYVEGEFVPSPEGGVPTRALPSYADLAKRFGLRTASVADRGRIGQWPRKREEFSQRLLSEVDQKRIETVSAAVVEQTRRELALGDKLLDAISALIQSVQDKDGAALMAPAAIDKLAGALKKLVEMRRISLNLDPPAGKPAGPEGAPDAKEHRISTEIRRRVLDAVLSANQAPPRDQPSAAPPEE